MNLSCSLSAGYGKRACDLRKVKREIASPCSHFPRTHLAFKRHQIRSCVNTVRATFRAGAAPPVRALALFNRRRLRPFDGCHTEPDLRRARNRTVDKARQQHFRRELREGPASSLPVVDHHQNCV
jgi:hypothetical protein